MCAGVVFAWAVKDENGVLKPASVRHGMIRFCVEGETARRA